MRSSHRDPRRHRGHRSDRLARTRHRRGGQPPGRARHAPGDGEGRRRGCLRGGPADVRRPMDLLAHPRQEPHRPRVRRVLPRRRHRWRSDGGAGGRADHGGTGVVHARPDRAGERRVGRGVSHRRQNAQPIASSASLRSFKASGSSASILEAGLRRTTESVERSRALGFTWAEGFASSFDGILHAVTGDLDTAQTRYSEALEIQQRIGDEEGAGLSLGGLAAAGSRSRRPGGRPRALPAVARRVRSDRRPGGGGADPLRDGLDAPPAPRPCARAPDFLDSVQAYTDVASVRGVGLSLIGLAATEAVEERPETAVQIAAAAEVYAQQEGIVNVYSDETPGREFVDQARAALSADDVARAPPRSAAGSRSRKRSTWPGSLRRPRRRPAGSQSGRGRCGSAVASLVRNQPFAQTHEVSVSRRRST